MDSSAKNFFHLRREFFFVATMPGWLPLAISPAAFP